MNSPGGGSSGNSGRDVGGDNPDHHPNQSAEPQTLPDSSHPESPRPPDHSNQNPGFTDPHSASGDQQESGGIEDNEGKNPSEGDKDEAEGNLQETMSLDSLQNLIIALTRAMESLRDQQENSLSNNSFDMDQLTEAIEFFCLQCLSLWNSIVASTDSADDDKMKTVYRTFFNCMDECLKHLESMIMLGRQEVFKLMRECYGPVLKAWEEIAVGEASRVQMDQLKTRRCLAISICAISFNDSTDPYCNWLPFKELLDFKSRILLAKLLFPRELVDATGLNRAIIDRSNLLSESFAYMSSQSPDLLRYRLSVVFTNEDAVGFGVVREWLMLVCESLFSVNRGLFVQCTDNGRRFLPSHQSGGDDDLDYFRFSGRVIGLALKYEVPVGICLARVFLLQLGGVNHITLDYVREISLTLFNSYTDLLRMDDGDVDTLGLTFMREYEQLGTRVSVELCAGGAEMAVDGKNKHEYVQLLLNHEFAESIQAQVASFAAGFDDIADHLSFFRCLEPEDLDRLLLGNVEPISVEDWRAHTQCSGDFDPQISWFWKVVGEMSQEQRTRLLFFWTSVKYLPFEGFRGLAQQLEIVNSMESPDLLPSSHTCFFQLRIPPYPTEEVMRDRLHFIARENVWSTGFGMN